MHCFLFYNAVSISNRNVDSTYHLLSWSFKFKILNRASILLQLCSHSPFFPPLYRVLWRTCTALDESFCILTVVLSHNMSHSCRTWYVTMSPSWSWCVTMSPNWSWYVTMSPSCAWRDRWVLLFTARSSVLYVSNVPAAVQWTNDIYSGWTCNQAWGGLQTIIMIASLQSLYATHYATVWRLMEHYLHCPIAIYSRMPQCLSDLIQQTVAPAERSIERHPCRSSKKSLFHPKYHQHESTCTDCTSSINMTKAPACHP